MLQTVHAVSIATPQKKAQGKKYGKGGASLTELSAAELLGSIQ